jgi:UDP-N-acetylmuramoyl-tripeptide--D-alanyl-D-alanine ligase
MIELSPTLTEALLEARDACAGVSTDTRAELEGRMYFALRGASFDGNAFVRQALEAGAAHAVTTDTRWKGTAHVTVVPDELGALQRFAWAYRKRWSCPVLGMTGSNGKTTTKELIRDVLATTCKVHATLGNLNNHIGVPLTLLNAPPDPEFVVVEMGANHRGEIALLASIAQPTHGYITNIGLAHLEGFGGANGVYLGKKELFDHLAETEGVAFVQTADAKVTKAAEAVKTKVDVGTRNWQWRPQAEGGACVQAPDGRTFRVNLEGAYNLANVAAAVRIGEHFDVPFAKAANALTDYIPQNHRSQAVQTSRNWVLLDAYNANPSSVANALADFGSRNHAAPLVLLGDMAELGDASHDAHRDVVHQALQAGAELWTVGPWFGKVHAESPDKGWIHWEHFDALAERLNRDPLTGRQILVKGSRSAALERVMPYL